MAIAKNPKLAVKEAEVKAEAETVVKPKAKAKPTPRTSRPKVDLKQEVVVINMQQGSLTYEASKGIGHLLLNTYLDSDYMTVEDLQIMKNTARGMFRKGWLYIDDEDVVKFLGLEKEMEAILLPEQLDELFNMEYSELKSKISSFSAAIKENIYRSMRIKFDNGELSNIHTIRAIEESLGVEPHSSLLHR